MVKYIERERITPLRNSLLCFKVMMEQREFSFAFYSNNDFFDAIVKDDSLPCMVDQIDRFIVTDLASSNKIQVNDRNRISTSTAFLMVQRRRRTSPSHSSTRFEQSGKFRSRVFPFALRQRRRTKSVVSKLKIEFNYSTIQPRVISVSRVLREIQWIVE